MNKIQNAVFILLISVIILYISPEYSSFLFWLPIHFLGCIISKYSKEFNVFSIFKNREIINIISILLLICLFVVAYFTNNNSSIFYSIYRYLCVLPVLNLLDNNKLDKKYFNVLD